MKFPDDCPQSFITDDWWVPQEKNDQGQSTLGVGTLLWALVNHVSVLPYRLKMGGRRDPKDHETARFSVEKFTVNHYPDDEPLPIAALPNYMGESYGVYRTKRRPVLVLAAGFPEVQRVLASRQVKYQVTPSILVAPYYGCSSETRVGFKEAFLQRIRHLDYPQYMWDRLPKSTGMDLQMGSVLRFDHLMPIGTQPDWYKHSGYRLSNAGIAFIKEWLNWIFQGEPVGDLAEIRKELQSYEP